MRFFKSSTLVLLFTLILFGFSYTQADDGGFFIENYNIELNLQEDGTTFAEEVIDVNFLEERHGIYRTIPIGGGFPLLISDTEVLSHKFITDQDYNSYTIKIGDADKYVIGNQKYDIGYTVFGATRQFSGYQELYRNLIGLDRDTSINKVNFKITLAKDIDLASEDIFFYYGAAGSKNTEAVIFNKTNRTIIGQLNQKLNAHEALTVGIKFPKNYFTFDTEKVEDLATTVGSTTSIAQGLGGGGLLSLGLPVGLLALFLSLFGTPKRRQKKVIPQYFPHKDLNPAEAGLLYNKRVKKTDIFSLFYHRAANGYLKIEIKTKKILFFKQKIFTLTPLKAIPTNTVTFELKFWENLFGIEQSLNSIELGSSKRSQSFQTAYTTTATNLKKHIESKGRYNKAAGKTNRMLFVGPFVMFMATALVTQGQMFLILINTSIAVVLAAVFYNHNTRLTVKGAELQDYIAGYRDFIKKVDETKLKTFLKNDPLFVDKTIAYAVAFGLQSKFMKIVSGMIQDTNINTRYIGDPNMNLNNLSSGLSNSFSPPTQSSGGSGFSGGSSGGGGGGGGGGSW